MISSRMVFVVEDDDSMRQAIERLLETAGYETTAFASAEALLAAGVDGALCIISDIKLPAKSGLKLLAELRTQEDGPPVIMITAHDEPGVRDQAFRCGAVAYLAKPFRGTALLAALDSAGAAPTLKR